MGARFAPCGASGDSLSYGGDPAESVRFRSKGALHERLVWPRAPLLRARVEASPERQRRAPLARTRPSMTFGLAFLTGVVFFSLWLIFRDTWREDRPRAVQGGRVFAVCLVR